MSAFTASDEALDVALQDANLPLLSCLYELTRGEKWLSPPYVPAPLTAKGKIFPDDSGLFSDALRADIKQQAKSPLGRIRDGTLTPATGTLSRADRQRIMDVQTGGAGLSEETVSMMLEEMGCVDRDVHLAKKSNARLGDFKAAVIGAGLSGICIASKLEAEGIAYQIFEKNDQPGGTWYENQYLACSVDTPNHFYSYSFRRNNDQPDYFSKQTDLFEYVNRCAVELGVRDRVQLNSEVTGATWRDDVRKWQLDINKAGELQQVLVDVLISAVGQLNRPQLPDIPGQETFKGVAFHSACWQYRHDLKGKRVGVIGTGCSAQQFLPWTADQAGQMYVFQRTPHWMVPHPDRSINALNDVVRAVLTDFIKAEIKAELGNRQDSLPQVAPDFPVWGKRLQIYNDWYKQLTRPNVELVCGGIRVINEKGLVTDSGREIELDALIYATGFHTNLFLYSMIIKGRHGRTLSEVWGDDPRAYKGVSVPDFPNLFCLYGPNTNTVHGGSIIFQIEAQVRYIMSCLTQMLDRDISVLDCKAEVNEIYNEKVQHISERLAWGHPNVSSWYKNSKGRVVNNSPFSLQDYWATTHDLDLNGYYLDYCSPVQ